MRRGGCLILAWIGASISIPAWAADPLDKPFGATPAELRAAAKASEANANATEADVIQLRYDLRVEIDAQRRINRVTHVVMYARTDAGLTRVRREDFGWDPSFRGPPNFRARAIDVAGKERTLAPTDIARHGNDGATVTLPGGVGSVIEAELALPESGTPFTEGERIEELVPSGRHDTVTVVAAASLHLHAPIVRGPTPPAITHAIANGQETWTYEFGAVPPIEVDGVPDGEVVGPVFAMTTGTSWAAIAKARRSEEDRAIGSAPLALPAGMPHTTEAVLAWARNAIALRDPVRLPRRTVADIVASGTGSPEERALVLVAALRQVGIPAETAIVAKRNGGAPDLDPALPGESLNDTYLVRAHPRGAPVQWLDPETMYAAAGVLGFQALGRHALAIARDATGLVETPAPRALAQESHVSDTYDLSRIGGATITERRWYVGSGDQLVRAQIAGGEDTDAMFAASAKLWGATLVSHAHDAPVALATPASMTAIYRDPTTVTTGLEIDAAISPLRALEIMPAEILRHTAAPPRTVGFQWAAPLVKIVETRFVIPPGFAPSTKLVPDGKRALGPATLTTHRALDGSTLVIQHRFDPGKLRMTAAEYEAMRTAVAALAESGDEHVRFIEAGHALDFAGKMREAVAEEQRLAALHPKDAYPHERLAQIYGEAGMGTAARREARAAVQIDPKAADAQLVLALVLAHDTFDRPYAGDWDRDGALAAARASLALAPKSVDAAVEIAILTEHDPHGLLRQGPQPDAIAAWRAALAIAPDNEGVKTNLVAAMLRAHDPGTETAARTMLAPSLSRDLEIAMAVAHQRGAAAGLAEAAKLRTGGELERVVNGMVRHAVLEREYALARELGAHATKPPANLATYVKFVDAGPADPRTAYANLLRASFQPDHVAPPPVLDPQILARYRTVTAGAASTEEVATEIDQLMATVKSAGDARGPWRLELPAGNATLVMYVALDHGVATLVGDPSRSHSLAPFFATHGADDRDAIAVMRWFVADAKIDRWKRTTPIDKRDLALAIAWFGANATRDIPILQACQASQPEHDDRQQCDRALGDVLYGERRWPDVEAHAIAWAGRGDPDGDATSLLISALTGQQRFDEADKVAVAALAKKPDDPWLQLRRAQNAAARGKLADAVKLSAFARKPSAPGWAANALAWLLAFEGRDLADAKVVADLAVLRERDAASLNTLATVEAARRELRSAYTHEMEALSLRGGEPTEADRFVLGRIAEELGLRDDARALYRQIAKPSPPPIAGDPSTYDFAQQRLAKL